MADAAKVSIPPRGTGTRSSDAGHTCAPDPGAAGYAACVVQEGWAAGVEEVSSFDDRREVALVEDLEILPDQTTDDTDAGWGERRLDNDDRLLAERPPHWD